MVTYPLGTEMYSVKQVAESLSLSTSTIQEAIEAGNLKAKKTGKQLLITREAVREYFDSLPESRRHKKAKWTESSVSFQVCAAHGNDAALV